MTDVGRKKSFTPEEFLEAVRSTYSLKQSVLGRELGCNRSTVSRFMKNLNDDPEVDKVLKEAKEFIEEISNTEYKPVSFEMFMRIPDIKELYFILYRKRRRTKVYSTKMCRGFYRICKYLKVHPRKLTYEDAVNLNQKIKDMYYDEDEVTPKGLNYQSVRESIRAYFMNIRGVGRDKLTNDGVTKENVKGYGKYSKMLVPQVVRHRFEKILKENVGKTIMIPLTKGGFKKFVYDHDFYLETIGICKFMYYTGTRINASLDINFRVNTFNLEITKWVIQVIDKGERAKGRFKWDKVLTAFALEEIKEILSERFKIPMEELAYKLSKETDYLFPILTKKYNNLRELVKWGLIEAGLTYDDFPPLHIWRHTFAQDCLRATNYNYELVASIGGWKSTKILKENYGEMGIEERVNGVLEAMGLEPEPETKELRW